MAVLTVTDERFQAVEEFALKVERTREDIVNEAIDRYLRREEYERVCAVMREAVKKSGITKRDVEDAILEVRKERTTRNA